MAVDQNMPILIVDDYKTMLKIERNLLNQLGFTLVFSDWNMQPMDGLSFLKKIRESKKFAKMPFIMVTAETKAENIILAKQWRVNNYIVKPFNVATLKTKMQAVIGNF